MTKSIWKQRYEDVRNVEHYLARNGTVVRKFFLHVSEQEQKRFPKVDVDKKKELAEARAALVGE